MSSGLEVAEAAARAAGRGLMARFGGHTAHSVHTKSSPTDMVSDADLEAEETIRALLMAEFPDDGFLGEEGDDVKGSTGQRWIIDPLDGTTNYLFGIPQWSVSIACETDGAMELGVIYDPVRDELFAGTPQDGASLNGVPLVASPRDELPSALIATGFAYSSEVRARQAQTLLELLPNVRDIRRLGSAALDLAWTAAGRYDAYYERGVKIWDIAAGVLLCRIAGLEIRELDEGDAGPSGVLVAGPEIVDALLALLS